MFTVDIVTSHLVLWYFLSHTNASKCF